MKRLFYSALMMLFTSVSYSAEIYYLDAVSGDDSNTGITNDSPWKSLSKVIELSGGAEIHLNPGNYYVTNSGFSSRNLTMIGNGTPEQIIVYGKTESEADGRRLIVTNGAKVTLENITFKNFSTSADNGACLRANNTEGKETNYTIKNVIFENCSALSGGAISFGSGNITCENVTFSNCNTTTLHGGGIVITDAVKNATFRNCNFLNNTAIKQGGGIAVNSTVKEMQSLTIIDSYFYQNKALQNHGGGAIMFSNSSPSIYTELILENNSFVENNAKLGNSAINISTNATAGKPNGLNFKMINNLYYKNSATNKTGTPQGGTLNIAGASGLYKGSLTWINNTFYENNIPNAGDVNAKSIFMNGHPEMDYIFINNLFFDSNDLNSFVFQTPKTEGKHIKSLAFKNNLFDSMGGTLLLYNDGLTDEEKEFKLLIYPEDENKKIVDVAELKFANNISQDLQSGKWYLEIMEGSAAINSGLDSYLVNDANIIPQKDMLGKDKVVRKDIGSFESLSTTSGISNTSQSTNLYYIENDEILLSDNVKFAIVYDANGRILSYSNNSIKVTDLAKEIFLIQFTLKNGQRETVKMNFN